WSTRAAGGTAGPLPLSSRACVRVAPFFFSAIPVVSIFTVGEPGPSDGDRAVGGAVVQPRDSGHGRALSAAGSGERGRADHRRGRRPDQLLGRCDLDAAPTQS